MHKPTLLAASLILTGAAGLALAQPAPGTPGPAATPPAPQAQAPQPPAAPNPVPPSLPGPRGEGQRAEGPGSRGPWAMPYGHPGMEAYGMPMMHHPHPHASRAASFHVQRGEDEIHIQCAEGEPMRACVDAASVLLDKLATLPPAAAPSAR